MSGHRAVISVGAGAVRRLCCGADHVIDDDTSEMMGAALAAIDDPVALVGERPVAVSLLWGTALRSVICASADGVIVVHPTWWSASRVATVTAAAATLTDDVEVRPRSWLLTRASRAEPDATLVVEIADRLVVISHTEIVALMRRPEERAVAEEVAGIVERAGAAVVLIDAPAEVAGAPALVSSIADATRGAGRTVVTIDDARVTRLAREVAPARAEPPEGRPASRRRGRTLGGLAAAGVVLIATVPAPAPANRHGDVAHELAPVAVETASTTLLVEGRVALAVPAGWPTQRIVAGPGSARVQVSSPSDPEVALHLTQSPVAGETLGDAAEQLRRAIDAEPVGVFVDFNPSALSAGRPVVTYREVRATHYVRWNVLVDGPVRISVGCQSRPGGEEVIRNACEQAVRSAHAIGQGRKSDGTK